MAAAATAGSLFKTPVYGQTQAPSPGRVLGANDRINVAYVGTGFSGFQIQSVLRSVQGDLWKAVRAFEPGAPMPQGTGRNGLCARVSSAGPVLRKKLWNHRSRRVRTAPSVLNWNWPVNFKGSHSAAWLAPPTNDSTTPAMAPSSGR